MSIRHRFNQLVGNRRSQSVCALGVVVVAAGVFLFAPSALATTGEIIRDVIGSILEFFIWAIGSLLFMVMKALISIAQYNHFVDSHTVELGWAIVRDLTNMFFVLLMLIVAFSTILGVPKDYVWTAVLPRLLVMAVLINFSKVIVGLLVDFSQVVMMTFVNGFSAAAGANMVNMLGIRNTVGFSSPSLSSPIEQWDTVAAMFLAVIMLGLSLAAVVMFMLMLVSRIVMIWILTILSPLAFFLSAVPSSRAKSQYAEWWKMLGEYLVAGPVLAFFLWLSFAVAGSGNLAEQEGFQPLPTAGEKDREGGIRSLAGEQTNFISYVVGLALLMGGMTITSRFNVIGGKALGGAVDWVKNKGTSFAKSAAKTPFRVAGAATGFVAKDLETRLYARTGVGLDPRRYLTGMKKGYQARVEDREKKGQGVVDKARLEGGWTGKYVRSFLGKPDQFVREHGVLGVPIKAAAAIPGGIRALWSSKVAPRATATYAKQFDEVQAQRRGLQDKMDEARQQQKAVTDLEGANRQWVDVNARLSVAQSEKERLAKKLAAEEKLGVPENFLVDKRAKVEAADASVQKLEQERDKVQDAQRVAGERAAGIDQGQVAKTLSGFEKEDTKLAKKEQFLREKAMTSRPKGIGELPKHKLQVEDLKVALDQSVDEKDAAGIQTVMRKAATDGMMGDLLQQYKRKNEKGEIAPYGADSAGFEQFSKDILQAKGKMGAQESLALADEISSLHKGESAAFANMTKASAGGQRRWASRDEREAATASDLGKGDVNEKLKKGSSTMIGITNDQGEFEMPPAAQAFIARFAETLDKRMSGAKGGGSLVSRSIMEKMAANEKGILDAMTRLLSQGLITQTKFDAIKSAIGKAQKKVATESGGGPAKIDDLAKEILRRQGEA